MKAVALACAHAAAVKASAKDAGRAYTSYVAEQKTFVQIQKETNQELKKLSAELQNIRMQADAKLCAKKAEIGLAEEKLKGHNQHSDF